MTWNIRRGKPQPFDDYLLTPGRHIATMQHYDKANVVCDENRDTWSGLCILECLEWHLVDGKCENCGYDWGSNVHGVRNMPGIRT